MKTAFVATVGIGTGPEADITRPLVKSINESNPGFLLLFATSESKGNAEMIKHSLQRTDANTKICVITEKNDVEIIFKEMLDQMNNLMNSGYEPANITADFTTGTKPMSAALVLVATKLRLGRLKYISVKRDDMKKVCPGTERTITFEPAGIYSSYTIELAIELILKYRFESAIDLLSGITTHHLSPGEKDVIKSLINIAEAYSWWDKFDHIKFHSSYAKVKFNKQVLKQFMLNEEVLSLIHMVGMDIKKMIPSEYTIIDIVNNARRRMEEGKYDDATARLYRAIEMLAQWRLRQKYGIDTSKVDLNLVPKKSIDWLNKCYDPNDKNIKISLVKGYQLLKDFDDELGKQFSDDKKLRAILNARNLSILAHGIKPIDKKSCEKLLNLVMEYIGKFVKNCDDYMKLLKFPWSMG